ncbi:DUF2790 domain-containing protein [Pseudomonas sp. SWI6]|uniref:DUF2790 domain-containing protein n=1 Tax=Pseudomonas sp. SWI6 TaxID=2083051 RepID=UPI000CE5E2F5|nr:DUF2790 domain-containing protein [Pseudomonas sp. SWI6]AVD82976.1 DUF2790 domain-containing protein [Pseudomonas sp. SWI6]
MKALLTLLLCGLCSLAMAEEPSADTGHIPVEPYSYSHPLDIARVVSLSSVPDVCEVVPARMTYEDSHGHRHIVEYRVLGNGCSNN